MRLAARGGGEGLLKVSQKVKSLRGGTSFEIPLACPILTIVLIP